MIFYFFLSEKNPKKLSDLCQDFSNAKNEWRLQLKTEAESNDPNKETVGENYIYLNYVFL